MSEAGYLVRVARGAKRELDGLDAPGAADLRDRIDAASRIREPVSHPKVKHCQSDDGFLIVRAEGCRAICELAAPEFRVLLAGKRRTVYDRLDVARRRAKEAEA